jgi:inner membrane protein
MRLGRKLLAIGGLMLLLLIPLALLGGLVEERQQRADEVVADIAQASAHAQRITAPLLRLEVERVLVRMERTSSDERAPLQPVERTEVETLLVAAEDVAVDATLGTETRRRGLFEARIFRQEASIKARFRLPALRAWPGQRSVRVRSAHWVLGLGDNRGIAALAITANGRPLRPAPGTGVAWLPEGVQAALPGPWVPGTAVQTEATLRLTGTSRLSWVPAAESFRWTLAGDWPHPRFDGFALPVDRKVRKDGFSAEWRLSALASQAPQRLEACAREAQCPGLEGTAVGLELLDPVDRYLMTDRAIKYALLFLGLVFGAVFLLEVLRGASVHPLHYLLVGLALALFFLLLLALSEHLGFGLAYGIAAAACVALIGYYLSGVLGGWKRGLGLATLLAALYGALYGLLQSEDHALLLGAVLLFGVLAATMVLTRRIDWGRLQ